MHCSICKDVFLEPVETTEGQVFCRDCITTWLVRERGTTCPLSSQPLTLEELKASRVLEAVIDDLRVRCKGCSTVMPHGSIGSHLGSCVAGTPCHGPAAALAERNGAREVVGSLKSASGSLGAEWSTPTRECTTPVMPRMGKENGVGWSTPSAMGAVASPAKKGKDNKARNLKQGVVFERYVGVFDKLPDFDAITPVRPLLALYHFSQHRTTPYHCADSQSLNQWCRPNPELPNKSALTVFLGLKPEGWLFAFLACCGFRCLANTSSHWAPTMAAVC